MGVQLKKAIKKAAQAEVIYPFAELENFSIHANPEMTDANMDLRIRPFAVEDVVDEMTEEVTQKVIWAPPFKAINIRKRNVIDMRVFKEEHTTQLQSMFVDATDEEIAGIMYTVLTEVMKRLADEDAAE